MQPTHSSRRILQPVKGWFIALSMFAALFLNLLPFGQLNSAPDWVALVLTFWCIHQPLRINMGAAFVFGLLMDVADSSVMGQHMLAYTLLAFTACGLSRRVLWFPLWQQALHILPLVLGAQFAALVVRLLVGGEVPSMFWFVGSFVGAVLWYPLTYLLLLPQYRPVDRDETRPI
jgi:rod shape-determining protein MreD